MPQFAFGVRSTTDDVLEGIDLAGKTVLVTGCASGIGFETMRALASHGARVVGLARTLVSAREACARVGGLTTPVASDLGDFGSITSAVATVRGLGHRLDAIITNAGIMCPKALTTRYGVELQFLVNYIGHFLLVNRLLDMVPSRTGRIVIVSSSASVAQAPKDGIMFDNLDGHLFYKPFTFYGQSKLATALFAKELSRRLSDRGIAVNSLHPGAVGGTSLQRSLDFPFNLIMPVASLFMKSIPQGAATQVFLAASPLTNGVTGEYWTDCKVARGSKYLADPQMARRLWTVSEKIVASHVGPA
jgi:NAD(P)-dependent dehydrogenase (short-subunit alcohol dehydrogenase family)